MIVVRIEMSRDKLFNIKTAHSIPNLKNVFKSASISFSKTEDLFEPGFGANFNVT